MGSKSICKKNGSHKKGGQGQKIRFYKETLVHFFNRNILMKVKHCIRIVENRKELILIYRVIAFLKIYIINDCLLRIQERYEVQNIQETPGLLC